MIDTLTSTPFFGLGLTLLCWFLAVKLQKRTGLLVCNPVLVAAMLVIAVMVVYVFHWKITMPAAILSKCCWPRPRRCWR